MLSTPKCETSVIKLATNQQSDLSEENIHNEMIHTWASWWSLQRCTAWQGSRCSWRQRVALPRTKIPNRHSKLVHVLLPTSQHITNMTDVAFWINIRRFCKHFPISVLTEDVECSKGTAPWISNGALPMESTKDPGACVRSPPDVAGLPCLETDTKICLATTLQLDVTYCW